MYAYDDTIMIRAKKKKNPCCYPLTIHPHTTVSPEIFLFFLFFFLLFLLLHFSHLLGPISSVELHKANMESRTQCGGGAGDASAQSAVAAAAASSALANALPLAQLLSKPGALSALGISGLTALTSLSEILTGAAGANQSSAVQTTGVHRSNRPAIGYEPKVRSSAGSSSPTSAGVKKERNKFAPY